MKVLANNAAPDEGDEFGDRAAFGVLPRKLEYRRTLASNGRLEAQDDVVDAERLVGLGGSSGVFE